MRRREALASITLAAAGSACRLSAQNDATKISCSPDAHVTWVGKVLARIETIKRGMTRQALEEVFTTEGGIYSSNLKRTFVSRDCPYFKVDVEFQAANGLTHDPDGREIMPENAGDVIWKISKPYLQFSISD